MRVLTRSSNPVDVPRHVEMVRGDLTLPETLDPCLNGVDAVFLVWVAPSDAVIPALERIAKRARRIVFLSSPHKTPHPFFQRPQPNAISSLHREIERNIEASELEWTFVRPGMFAANTQPWWAPQLRAGDVVRWPYPSARTAPIHEGDIAAVAVRSLCEDGHDKGDYVVTGPQSLSQSEQLSIIGSVIQRSLRMEEISPEEARTELLSIMPLPVVNMLLKAWEGAMSQSPLITSTVQEITGIPARTFLDWATGNAAGFRS